MPVRKKCLESFIDALSNTRYRATVKAEKSLNVVAN